MLLQREKRSDAVESLLADPSHLHQVVCRCERSMVFPVEDDTFCVALANAGKLHELVLAGTVRVDAGPGQYGVSGLVRGFFLPLRPSHALCRGTGQGDKLLGAFEENAVGPGVIELTDRCTGERTGLIVPPNGEADEKGNGEEEHHPDLVSGEAEHLQQ